MVCFTDHGKYNSHKKGINGFQIGKWKRCSNFLPTSKMIKGETKKERNNTREIPADFSCQFLIFMFFYINGKRPSSSKTNEMLNFSFAKSDSE